MLHILLEYTGKPGKRVKLRNEAKLLAASESHKVNDKSIGISQCFSG